jgi:hypothetical protein
MERCSLEARRKNLGGGDYISKLFRVFITISFIIKIHINELNANELFFK